MFSVVILTLNEEKNLRRCLSSIAGCSDVVVLDSGSTDKTLEIAASANCRVFSRTFDSFAGQRNWAHLNIPFSHPWVFHLDADECFTRELMKECHTIASDPPPLIDGYFVAPRMLWKGKWVPHSTDFPAYQARFVRWAKFRFIQSGHGQREAPATCMGRLESNYLHEMCSEGVDAWLEKHRHYAALEAKEYLTGIHSRNGVPLAALFSRDPMSRRRALKRLSYRLPFRPSLRFLYQYILKRGFLDGRAGLQYCRLLSKYEGFAAHEISCNRKATGA
jgi:glycosyltransferase involved in cell wall biosynthesis